jgi:putative spermidine/putrescine transport system permease protein
MCGLAIVGFAFLATPILMVFPLSVDPSPTLRFPPSGFSLRWYEAYFSSEPWMSSTVLSLQVAAGATCVASVVGTLAAIGLIRGGFPGRRALGMLLISPLLLPTVVVAIAIYRVYAAMRLVGTPLGLISAHAVLGVPFVVLNVAAALRAVPPSYEEAALSLGATPLTVLREITLPLAWRGVIAGAVFAFVVSFDEVVIAMFMSGTTAITLPKRMLDGIFFELSPTVAAVSALLVIANVALATTGLALAHARRGTEGRP